MPSKNTENYARIVLIIANCGTLLTKKLFEKRVKDLFPNDNISGFLDKHKPEISKAEKHIQRTLFPTYGDINIQKWDLTIFCFLLQICNLEQINRSDIQKLKDMRNDIYHLPKPALSVSEYQSRIVEITTIFERTCTLIDDELFKEEFSQMFSSSKNDLDLVKELVKKDREMVERENCWFKLIAEKQEKMLIKIEECREEHNVLLQTIVSRVGRIESRLDTTSPHLLEYPDNQIEIQFRNCPTDREKTLSDLLTELFMNEIHGSHVITRNTFSEMEINMLQEAIRKTAQQMIAKGRPVSNAASHCVLLTINCNSLSSLIRFMNDSLNGSLCYDFRDLLVAVRSIKGFKETTFQIAMKEDQILTSLEKALDVLDSFEPETGISRTAPEDNVRLTDDSGEEIISKSPGKDIDPEAPNACNGESPEDVIADLKRELEKFRQMAVLEKDKNGSLQKSYDKLKKEFEDQASLISGVKDGGGKQSSPMTKERDQEISDLKREISFLNGLNINLEGCLKQKSAEHKAGQKALESLKKENEVLGSQSKARQEHVLPLQSELKRVNEKNDDLEAQLESLKKEYSLYKYQSQARQEHDQSKTLSLQSEIKKISEKHDSIEAKHDSLKKEYEIYKTQTNARQEQDQSKIISLQSELKTTSENNNDLKVELESRNKEYEKHKSQYKARQEEDRSKILSLQLELKKISKKNGSEAKFESLKKEYETHKTQCKASQEQDQSKILSLQSELQKIRDNNVSLEAQVDSINMKYELLDSQFRARQEQDQNKIISLQSELKEISENKNDLKAQRDSLHKENETYKSRSISREEQYRSEIRSLKSELDLQIEINDDLMATRDSLKKRLDELEEKERQDPRTAGFYVGARVKDIHMGLEWTGTVTAVDPTGYVDVEWDNCNKSRRLSAGVNGEFDVIPLQTDTKH